ncbi:proteinase inhibitor i78 [Asticcacaulis excentricus]|uniref:Proteinase inhibitor I78 n=1 Tax=Asticcacaulis excentricus (strain ATCC 15261 / DSM 4724 / KCTC 12464 / NCIMB 9791 / VKM B-1370 / CB 48) TaxID=573065 RepID=E8RT40_ASTEC|nr:proteinase inhibitor i78 [Asticcacaulis excentricus]ADU14661.1 Proteinase inhibitor I78 [Asticcacaulis excentricus CB 48]
MMKKIATGSALLLLAACSTPIPAPVSPPSPPPVSRPTPQKPPEFKPVDTDKCEAKGLQYLVGKPRTQIPVPLEPSKRRVLCSTCAATMDYRADRQTIIFDTDTGIIKSVTCG